MTFRRRLAGCLALLLVPLAAASAQEPAAPARVAFLGDSMMKLLGHQGTRVISRLPQAVVATNFSSIGSGLARLDAFDWIAKIDSVMAEQKPDIVILALGANDKQPMQIDGQVLQPGDPDWTREYRLRVGKAMDRLIAGGARRILWLELPDMKSPSHQADADAINAAVEAEAATRPAVLFFRIRPFLSRTPGEFTKYRIDPRGKPIDLRDGDGIHLTRAGADLVMDQLIAFLWPQP